MSDIRKYDLMRECCEYDDQIKQYKFELEKAEETANWLRRKLEILEYKKRKIVEELREGKPCESEGGGNDA